VGPAALSLLGLLLFGKKDERRGGEERGGKEKRRKTEKIGLYLPD
jgi:hypothetical protein